MRALVTRAIVLATLASAAAVGGSAPANADTIYDFMPTATLGSSGQAIGPFSLQLDLYDGFTPESFSRYCMYGVCTISGNFSDFSLTATYDGHLLDTLDDVPSLYEELTYGTFNGSSGSLFWNGTASNGSDITLTLTFGNGVWNANFNSDDAPLGPGAGYCQNTGCTAYGTVAQVPEPAAFGVFATGLIALAATRNARRRPRSFRLAAE